MTAKKCISVIVPAYNEEEMLPTAVASAIAASKAADVTIEIIIVNDGSKDRTGAVADQLKRRYSFIQTIHHPTNFGVGASFLDGIKAARYEWAALFPGDNVVSIPSLRDMFRHAGDADIILSFTVNTECRNYIRGLISPIFTFLYVTVFTVPLRYIQATPIFPVQRLRKLQLRARRYSFLPEITVKFLRSGCTFMEIPGYMNPGSMKSSALSIKSLYEVMTSYLLLIWDIHFSLGGKYSKRPVRVIPEESR